MKKKNWTLKETFGPTKKGPVCLPEEITTEEQFYATFGQPKSAKKTKPKKTTGSTRPWKLASPKMPPAPKLCSRCEHRISFNESGHGPRFECHQTERPVRSCYMYTPVLPILLEPNDGDNRPIDGGWAISPRSHGVRVACNKIDVELRIKEDGMGRFVKYWAPITVEVAKKKAAKK